MKFVVRPELPTASVGSSQAPTAAVDNSAPLPTRPQSTYRSGKAVQTNGATSHFLEKTQAANWIFLPAALRLIAVLVWGLPGALGLWVGAIVTSGQVFGYWTPAVLIAAPMSALAPLLAVTLMREPLALKPDLSGLGFSALAQLAMANATCSALLHSLTFLWLNDYRADPADILIMMVGDLIGTLVVLYALKLGLDALRR